MEIEYEPAAAHSRPPPPRLGTDLCAWSRPGLETPNGENPMSSFDLFAGIVLLAASSWFLGDVFERGVSRGERMRSGLWALWAFSAALYVVQRSRPSTLAIWLFIALNLAVIVSSRWPPPRRPNSQHQ